MKVIIAVIIILVVILVGILVTSSSAYAATDVHFLWEPNSEPDLAGYRIFRRLPGEQYDYTSPVVDIPCGANDSTCARGFDPLVPDGTYFWVVRAYDTEGYESEDSNEQTDTLISVSPAPDSPKNLIIQDKVIIIE